MISSENPVFLSGLAVSKLFIMLVLTATFLASLYIRVHGTSYYHYSPDEMMEIDIAAQKTLPEMLHTAMHETVHPPLGYIVRHFWMKMATDPSFIRSEALLWGLLLIPLYYAIGKTISGEFTGLCAAILAGFSQGLIIQSYLARNYTLFVLLLSIGFYYFLRWHATGQKRLLLSYTLFGCLACLTHFSGMFAFFSMAVCEWVWLYKSRAALQKQMAWWVANGIIAIVALSAYHLWQPIIAGLHSDFSVTPTILLIGMPIYPASALGYILPGIPVALGLMALIMSLFLFPATDARNTQLCFYLLLACCALGLGTALLGSGVYPFLGTRRSLWLTPFIITATAYGLEASLQRVRGHLSLRHPAFAVVALIALFGICAMCYSPHERFRDTTEYPLPEAEFQALTAALATLPKPYLIIAEKDDSVLLQNPYPYITTPLYPQEDRKQNAELTALIPYSEGNILINPLYHRIFSGDMLLKMLQYANDHAMLGNVGSLVFLHTPWSVFPMQALLDCKALEKKTIVFPAYVNIAMSAPMLVIIPRRALLDGIVAAHSPWRACLMHGLNAPGAGGGS